MKKTKQRKVMIIYLLALLMVMIPSISVFAAGYNPEAAKQYAYNNYTTSSELCAGFVSKCVQAGGADITLKRTVGPLKDELAKYGFIPMALTKASDGKYYYSDNTFVSIGDVIIWHCPIGDTVNMYHWKHAALVTKIENNQIFVSQTNAPLKDGNISYFGFNDCNHNAERIVYCYHWPSEPFVMPTISMNQESYRLGETMQISWTASSSASTLKRYHVQIWDPQMNMVVDYNADKNVGYHFQPTMTGTYTIEVHAYGYIDGQLNLYKDSKKIEVGGAVGNTTLQVTGGNNLKETVFTWNVAEYAKNYEILVYDHKNQLKSYPIDSNCISGNTVTFKLLLESGQYSAQVCSVGAGSNNKKYSEKVPFSVASVADAEGWYYTNSLPQEVTAAKYDIEYKHTYVADLAPGVSPEAGYEFVEVVDYSAVKSGEPYYTAMNVTETETLKATGNYYYFHYCGANTGSSANFEASGNYVHGDTIWDVASVYVVQAKPDVDDSRYTFYHLKWNNGSDAYCQSGTTCDGQYGSHGSRSCYWYKKTEYQNYVITYKNRYRKETGWSATVDNTASTTKYRYKLKETEKPQENPFADVKETSWQYKAVKFALDNKLMAGKKTDAAGKIVFDPEKNMTRAEFIQTLYNKEGKPDVEFEQKFSDVKAGDWFADAIIWASKEGLIAGKGKIFDVSGNIARQEIAVILHKYAKYNKYDATGSAELLPYGDDEKIASWAQDAMRWAISKGVMKGKGSGNDLSAYKLDPTGDATRAECAAMLKNFMDTYQE